MHVHPQHNSKTNKQTKLSLTQIIKLVYLDRVNKKDDPTNDPSLTCRLTTTPSAH